MAERIIFANFSTAAVGEHFSTAAVTLFWRAMVSRLQISVARFSDSSLRAMLREIVSFFRRPIAFKIVLILASLSLGFTTEMAAHPALDIITALGRPLIGV
ncbi:hypothetical protein B0H14DRAFT_3486547 [Mycena olivaceomarginata]|nr:hypothetical protein B0H14DRAFT_3486547 [Mycena olivaceomarginata]